MLESAGGVSRVVLPMVTTRHGAAVFQVDRGILWLPIPEFDRRLGRQREAVADIGQATDNIDWYRPAVESHAAGQGGGAARSAQMQIGVGHHGMSDPGTLGREEGLG